MLGPLPYTLRLVNDTREVGLIGGKDQSSYRRRSSPCYGSAQRTWTSRPGRAKKDQKVGHTHMNRTEGKCVSIFRLLGVNNNVNTQII